MLNKCTRLATGEPRRNVDVKDVTSAKEGLTPIFVAAGLKSIPEHEVCEPRSRAGPVPAGEEYFVRRDVNQGRRFGTGAGDESVPLAKKYNTSNAT